MLIVHAADLHLDSPLRDLPKYESAPVHEVRAATRRAFEGLVSYCLSEDAKVLLLAGDLYDGDYRDHATALFLTEQLSRLRETGTQVVWIRGNHDAESRITRHLRLPSNCRELRTSEPETVLLEELGVAIHGQGYARADMGENLAKGYPRPYAGYFNVGLLHTALEGRAGHGSYAPCTALELSSLGYDYFALGHVHTREVLELACPIVFPGNLQGRHIRECGAKGATTLRVEGQRLVSLAHQPFDVVRWAHARLEAGALTKLDEFLDAGTRALERAVGEAEGRTVAIRVEFFGTSPGHATLLRRYDTVLAELRRVAVELGGVYLEDVVIKTKPLATIELGGANDAVSEMFAKFSEISSAPEQIAAYAAKLERLFDVVPSELREEVASEFPTLLVEAIEELAARISSPEGES